MPNRHLPVQERRPGARVGIAVGRCRGRHGELHGPVRGTALADRCGRYDHGVCRLPLLLAFAGSVAHLLSPNPGPGERHRFQSRDRHFFWRGSGLHHGRIYR